jgi:ribosomal protein L33
MIKLTSTKLQLLIRWCSSMRSYWHKGTPYRYRPEVSEFYDHMIVWETGYAMLADKLILPRVYLTDSRIPRGLRLQKWVTIPNVGRVKFYIYASRDKTAHFITKRNKRNTFIRFYMDCPFCGKHTPVGRFHQHAETHMDMYNG